MKVTELYKFLDRKIPSSLSCEWDNDGLMCCPEPDKDVKRVLITLDITSEAIKEAAMRECDVIISHHPLIFKGIKSVNENGTVSKKVIELIKNGISAFSFHTRLDALNGGVNDILSELLELDNISCFGECDIGRVGELREQTNLDSFARFVKERLNAPAVLTADANRAVKRIALLGGEGGDDIEAAKSTGADTYISGRLGYHEMTDAPEMGINLIEAGHFYTEYPVCTFLEKLVKNADSQIEVIGFFSNRIKMI